MRNASADGEGGVGGGGGATAASALAASSGASAGGPAGGGGGHGETVSPLAQFLIERACKSLELANFFYWYLRVDLEDATHGHIYRGVQAAFKRVMKQTPESARVMGKHTRVGLCGGSKVIAWLRDFCRRKSIEKLGER